MSFYVKLLLLQVSDMKAVIRDTLLFVEIVCWCLKHCIVDTIITIITNNNTFIILSAIFTIYTAQRQCSSSGLAQILQILWTAKKPHLELVLEL